MEIHKKYSVTGVQTICLTFQTNEIKGVYLPLEPKRAHRHPNSYYK